MNFFSYTCAKTGLPIMAGSAASQKDHHLCEVVVLFRAGDRYIGTYDGHGRVGALEVAELMSAGQAKMVLKFFDEGEEFGDVPGMSSHEPKQGFLHNWEFVHRAFKFISYAHKYRDDLPEGVLSTRQFSIRDREHDIINAKIEAHLKEWFGVPVNLLADVHGALMSGLEHHNSDSDWREQWAVHIAPRLMVAREDGAPEVASSSPLRTMECAAALVMYDGFRRMLDSASRNEVMLAWQEDRPARMPNVVALMKDPIGHTAWSDSALAAGEAAEAADAAEVVALMASADLGSGEPDEIDDSLPSQGGHEDIA